MSVQRQDQNRDRALSLFRRKLHRVDGVLERGVVELHHVLSAGWIPLETAGEVDVDDIEAARAEAQILCRHVDDHLVDPAHLAAQPSVRPGETTLAVHLDRQRVLVDDDAATQLQLAAHPSDDSAPASATMPSQTPSIASRLRAETLSSGVWLASVPLASRTQSKPLTISALASLPPPVAVRCGS